MTDEQKESYFKIRINSLHADYATTFDLYVKINTRMVHYLRAGDKIEQGKIATFEARQLDVFYIREADRAAYKAYVHDTINSDDLNVRNKAMILRESTFSLVEELFEHPDVNTALDGSKEVIHQFVDFMDGEPEAMSQLIGLSSHDFYTYNHSLDVSVYSIGLGAVVGFSSKKDLTDLGQGSLLHDIGKRHVSTEIICKKGPLDDQEWAQMKMHPTFGLKILNDNPEMTDNIKACAFEHHESFGGNGYPQGIPGKEIHPMARIVALTDTYDALTTKRSYNEPMSPTQALQLMKEKLAGRYDPEMLQAMHSILFKLKI